MRKLLSIAATVGVVALLATTAAGSGATGSGSGGV